MNAENIGAVLDALAARFGSTGAHLWEVLIRQVYVESVVWFIYATIVGAGFFGLRRLFVHFDENSDEPELWKVVFGGVWGIMALIALLGGLFAITAVLNPEYAALQKIFGAINTGLE